MGNLLSVIEAGKITKPMIESKEWVLSFIDDPVGEPIYFHNLENLLDFLDESCDDLDIEDIDCWVTMYGEIEFFLPDICEWRSIVFED